MSPLLIKLRLLLDVIFEGDGIFCLQNDAVLCKDDQEERFRRLEKEIREYW